MLVNFMGFKSQDSHKVSKPPVSFNASQPKLQYQKHLTQDTVSFKGFPGDSRERDLLEGLKCRNPRRLEQLEKEGFNYQSPYLEEAIKVLEAWRKDTMHSDPDLSWKLGELRAVQQYKTSDQFLEDARRLADMVYM
ncbi:MAG: hypothetical protein AB1782_20430 [Cyanobacteriota bacterium]